MVKEAVRFTFTVMYLEIIKKIFDIIVFRTILKKNFIKNYLFLPPNIKFFQYIKITFFEPSKKNVFSEN